MNGWTKETPLFRWGSLAFLAIVGSTILLRGIGDSSLGYPDADRILMDGVFILDFLRELPFSDPFGFTAEYFVKYPALSIGYRPPFFPFVEAIFNGIFGVNMWSSRLALLLFALAGMTAWFELVRRHFGTPTALFSGLLLFTTPFVARWGWYTMAEIPVLAMCLITADLFDRYCETGKAKFIYFTAISFAMAAWTKQTAVFIGVWFLLYLLFTGRLLQVVKQKHTWIAAVIALVMLAPLAAITLWLGDMNIHQSVGNTEGVSASSRLSLHNLAIHLNNLWRLHLTAPVLVLSLLGLLWAAAKREKKAIYFALLILTVYGFFTYLNGKNPRYPIFWIPAFCLFAALPVYFLSQWKAKLAPVAGAAVLTAVALFQVVKVYDLAPAYATGYRDAARYVVEDRKGPTILVDAYNNGYFTYFVRAAAPDPSIYVLRADKLLTSSAISPKHWLTVHAKSRADIEEKLNKFGVVYVIVESKDYSGIEIHKELRAFLETDAFALVKDVPIKSNRHTFEAPLNGQSLKIYEYKNAKAPAEGAEIVLDLPLVGQKLRIPLNPKPTGSTPKS